MTTNAKIRVSVLFAKGIFGKISAVWYKKQIQIKDDF